MLTTTLSWFVQNGRSTGVAVAFVAFILLGFGLRPPEDLLQALAILLPSAEVAVFASVFAAVRDEGLTCLGPPSPPCSGAAPRSSPCGVSSRRRRRASKPMWPSACRRSTTARNDRRGFTLFLRKIKREAPPDRCGGLPPHLSCRPHSRAPRAADRIIRTTGQAAAPDGWRERPIMLDMLRRSASGFVGMAIIGILVIAFAVWGIADIFTGFTGDTVAEVGDQKIDSASYDREFRAELDRMSERLGQPLTREQGQRFGVDRLALSRLIGVASARASP